MDLVGSINYIENRLGGRNPNQGKGKPAPKKPRNDAADDKSHQTDSDNPPSEYNTRLGQKIDTTA